MLSPYTVLELTDDRGELASMVLGDLGADAIKVEPAEGSRSRQRGPFLEDAAEPERSLHFFAFNRNKSGITLDLTSEAGDHAFLRLVERADFLTESARPGEMAELGLGFGALRQVNPRLISSRHRVVDVLIDPDGTRSERWHRFRFYSLTELSRMLLEAGLELRRTSGGRDGSTYGPSRPRMVVLARKPADDAQA